MQHTLIKNDIIRKILDVEDDNFLEFIQELLNVKAKKSISLLMLSYSF